MTIRNLFLASLLLVAAASPAAAQNATTGAIQGVVTDAASGDGLAGVTVVVTSPALQGTQSAITDGSGVYKITNLPPGMYSATFYYSDITVRRNNIGVGINRTTPGYVKMNTSQAGGEVIVIDDKAPTVDVTSTNQGIRLDQDYTRNIPVPGRTFESALGAAPGSSGDGMGVSFSGSSSLENSYVVDGVNTTSLTYGTVGAPLINEFIEEIEIITGGYNAEYGRATGGVVNVVTKSGSNEFKGSVFTYVTPGFMIAEAERAASQSTALDGEGNLAYRADFGFELGGPIVKDKVWFYVGFAPQLARTNIDRITQRHTDCRGYYAGATNDIDGNSVDDGMDDWDGDGTTNALEDIQPMTPCNPATPANGGFADGDADEDPATGFVITEEVDRQRLHSQQTFYQFVSKINFALAPEHQGQISLIGSPGTADIAGVFGAPSATSFDYFNLTTDLAAKWTSKFNDNKTELEAVLGWHRDSSRADSIDDAVNDTPRQDLLFGTLGNFSQLGYETDRTRMQCQDSGGAADIYPFIDNCPIGFEGYSVGGPGGILDTTEQRFSARLSATQRIPKTFGGSHEIKAGLDLEDNRLNNFRDISGGVYYQNLYSNELGAYDSIYSIRWVRLAPPGAACDVDAECAGDERCVGGDGAEGGEVTGACVSRSFEEDCVDAGAFDSTTLGCEYLFRDPVKGETVNWSAYARDSWQPMPNLTINYGLRYEEQRLRYSKSLQGTNDPFTGVPRGKNAMTLTGMFAPRLGAVYDWTKEGRAKVYGHWGRFYEAIPMNINNRSFGGEVTYQQVYPLTQCGPEVPGFGGPSGPGCEAGSSSQQTIYGAGTLVAPGIKAQYLDEWIVGSEYEVIEDLKLGIALQDRRLGRILEDVSVDNADTYIIANPGEVPQGDIDALKDQLEDLMNNGGDPADIAVLANQIEQFEKIRVFDKPRRDYQAIQLTAVKRFSKSFFAQGSYTYSRTKGNFQGLFSSANGQVDPNITSQFDLIELTSNQDGPLPQDRPHYIKIDGYYTFDFKKAGSLTTGLRFRALSGTPRNALGRHYRYGFNESFLLPRGAMGRNPFDMGLDIRVAYSRALTRGMEMSVFFDLFGIPNRQTTADVDEAYTTDSANPIVGGTYQDLVFAKALGFSDGGETTDPVVKWPNFGNTSARYAPLYAQLGARLTF
jgi:hypothetical protein